MTTSKTTRMPIGNINFRSKLIFISLLLINLGCTSGDSGDDENEIPEPYVSAEIGGNTWVGDSITRSGISRVRDTQSYSLMAQDNNFFIYITLIESDTFEEGVISPGKYRGTKIFMEFGQFYGNYAIQGYFQENRSTSNNEIEIIHSDGNTISGNFSGTFYKGDRNYPPVVDENSPDIIYITNGKFRNMPLNLFPSYP